MDPALAAMDLVICSQVASCFVSDRGLKELSRENTTLKRKQVDVVLAEAGPSLFKSQVTLVCAQRFRGGNRSSARSQRLPSA